MTKILAAGLALALALASVGAGAGYFDDAEARKAHAHMMAEAARALGYDEDSIVIRDAKAIWQEAQAGIEEELDVLARVVYFEAGSSWLTDREQQLVACVVLNRCADDRFPDTIAENVYRRGQYACAKRLYTVARESIPDRCYANARAAAYGEVECPANVVWQAQFRQGKGVYEQIGKTYFCY